MAFVKFESVYKSFHRHQGQRLIRQHLRDLFHRAPGEPFYAVKNLSFEIQAGESVAFLGGNGAGKSTTLAMIAGLAKPSSGRVEVNGRVGALLELGSGFHAELTGAENIRMNAALLGIKGAEFQNVYGNIIDFSGLEEFLNEPIRTYSTGMVMRLAFSVAINLNPDVLLVDEILAVGDHAFQAKCGERIHQFRESGGTLICVSHAAAMVQQLCERAIWLDHGEAIMTGSTETVLAAYHGQQPVNS